MKYQDTALWDIQYHSISGWAKNLLKFQIQKIEKWHHKSTGAQEQGAIREGRKKDFVSLHSMTSAKRKSKQG